MFMVFALVFVFFFTVHSKVSKRAGELKHSKYERIHSTLTYDQDKKLDRCNDNTWSVN